MAKVRINGDTSGYIELASPAAAGSNTITLPSSNGSANQLLKNSGTAGTLDWSTLTEDSSGNLNIDSGTLYVDASNNRVGVGTTSPRNVLDVNGTIYVAGGNQIQITGSGGTTGLQLIGQDAAESLIGTMSAQALAIRTNSTERARIDSSGRLLVGTSSSASTTDAQYGLLQIQGNGTSSSGGAILTLRRGEAATSITSGETLGYIVFTDTSGNRFGEIYCDADGTAGSSDYPGRLVFSTTADGASSPTERMRITNGGLLKATTGTQTSRYTNSTNHAIVSDKSTEFLLVCNHTSSTNPNGIAIEYTAASPNNTSNNFLECIDSTTVRAVFRSNGGLANYSGNNVNLCDRNAKKDIAPADGTWDCLKEWEIVNFRYKDQPDDADLNMGVIAQQIAESCPEAITVFQEATEDQPEKLGVKEQQMMWMAIKALQEAQLRIEQLETLNVSFEARLAALEVKP
jgi:hypothetical protein